MKIYRFCSVVLLGLLGSNNLLYAEELGVELVSVKPHSSIERTHVCAIVKAEEAGTADCNDPKCTTGGAAVDAALASKNMKRICKTIGASVNRGFDVTYAVNGTRHVAWTARDPEPDLNRIGLTPFEEHSPLNPVCAQLTFKEASSKNECTDIKQ